MSQRGFEERGAASGDVRMHHEVFALFADADLEGLRHVDPNHSSAVYTAGVWCIVY